MKTTRSYLSYILACLFLFYSTSSSVLASDYSQPLPLPLPSSSARANPSYSQDLQLFAWTGLIEQTLIQLYDFASSSNVATQSSFATAFGATQSVGIWAQYSLLRPHAADHLLRWKRAAADRGITLPSSATACTPTFSSSVTDVTSLLTAAEALERAASEVYAQLVGSATDIGLQSILTRLASVNARHAEWMATIQTRMGWTVSISSLPTLQSQLDSLQTLLGCTLDLPILDVRPTAVHASGPWNTSTPAALKPVSNAYYSVPMFENDVIALNFLLTVSQLQQAFYSNVQDRFQLYDYEANYSPEEKASLYFNAFGQIYADYTVQTSRISDVITARGGTPVPLCSYNIMPRLSDMYTFITLASTLETNIIKTYAGIIPMVTDVDVQNMLTAMLTTLSHHLALILSIDVTASVGAGPFFDAFPPAFVPADALTNTLQTGLILSCAYSITSPQPVAPVTTQTNDVSALQYLLGLELLLVSLFQTASQYTRSQFTSAGYASAFDAVTLSSSHENAHVTALSNTITSLGAIPTSTCVYNWANIVNVQSLLRTIAQVETVVAAAYDGALTALTDPSLQSLCASFSSIEARHAAYFNSITSGIGGSAAVAPNVTDLALNPTAVWAQLNPFIASCPSPLYETPIVRPTGYTTPTTLTFAVSSSPASEPGSFYSTQHFANDIVVLNFVLLIENMLSELLRYGQAKYTQSQFITQYGVDPLNGGSAIYLSLTAMTAHEVAHATTIRSMVTARGGRAVAVCGYNFAAKVTSIPTYVTLVATLAQISSAGYNGVLQMPFDTNVQLVMEPIATVEARYASYFASVTGSVFLGASTSSGGDNSAAPADTLAAITATGLLGTCPYTILSPSRLVFVDPNFNDLISLNFLLSMQQLESNFYAAAYSSANFNLTDSYLTQQSNPPFPKGLSDTLGHIYQHDAEHVQLLQDTLYSLGGVPVLPCTYTFDAALPDVGTFVAAAAAMESMVVSATDALLNTITSPNLQQLVQSIIAIDARHASVLSFNSYLRTASAISWPPVPPFAPLSAEPILPLKDVFNRTLLGQYISQCSLVLTVPVIRSGGVALNVTARPPVATITSPAPQSNAAYSTAQQANDIRAIQLAFAVSQVQASFYSSAQSRFAFADFLIAGFQPRDYQWFSAIATHAFNRSSSLRAILVARNAAPIGACTYRPVASLVTNVSDLLSLAWKVESLSTSTFVGLSNTVADTNVVTTFAAFSTVTARHTAYFASLNLSVAIPALPTASVDPILAPANLFQLWNTTTNLVASCPLTSMPSFPSIVAGPVAPVPSPYYSSSSSSSSSTATHSSSAAASSSSAAMWSFSSTGVASSTGSDGSSSSTSLASSSTGAAVNSSTGVDSTGMDSNSTNSNSTYSSSAEALSTSIQLSTAVGSSSTGSTAVLSSSTVSASSSSSSSTGSSSTSSRFVFSSAGSNTGVRSSSTASEFGSSGASGSDNGFTSSTASSPFLSASTQINVPWFIVLFPSFLLIVMRQV